MRLGHVLFALACLSTSGCVKRSTYDAALAKNKELTTELDAANTKHIQVIHCFHGVRVNGKLHPILRHVRTRLQVHNDQT